MSVAARTGRPRVDLHVDPAARADPDLGIGDDPRRAAAIDPANRVCRTRIGRCDTGHDVGSVHRVIVVAGECDPCGSTDDCEGKRCARDDSNT